MLLALALLGILPAAFVFGESMFDDSDKDEDTHEHTYGAFEAKSEDVGDLDSQAVSPIDEDMQDSDADASEMVSDGTETDIEKFAVGDDKLTVHLTGDGSGEFIVESLQDADGAPIGVSLSYLDDDAETTFNFIGLDEVPASDITIGVTSQETGDEALYLLADLGDFGAIDPNDPDEQAVANPSTDPDETVLAPSDPDEAGIPGGESDDDVVLTPNVDEGDIQPDVVDHLMSSDDTPLVLNDSPFEGGTDAAIVADGGRPSIETASTLHRVTGTDGADIVALGDDAAIVEAGAGDDQLYAGDGTAILSGGDGNDTLVGGNDTGSDYLLDGGLGDDTLVGGDAAELLIGGAGADILSGGAGDDTLVLDAFDAAEGGAGVDTFWVYEASENGADVAQISDFEQGVDILRVSMPATSDLGEDTSV